MNEILIGAIATLSLTIRLYFWRFWRSTRDKFFLFFAIAFLIGSASWLSLYFVFGLHEASPWYYLIRLVAYLFILAAIFTKNMEKN